MAKSKTSKLNSIAASASLQESKGRFNSLLQSMIVNMDSPGHALHYLHQMFDEPVIVSSELRAHRAKLKKELDTHKRDWLKFLIEVLRDYQTDPDNAHYDIHEIMLLLDLAATVDVQWPELKMLQRSIDKINSDKENQVIENATYNSNQLASAITRKLIETGKAIDLKQQYGIHRLIAAIDKVSANARTNDIDMLIRQVYKEVTGSEIAEDLLDDPNANPNPAQQKPSNPAQAPSAQKPTQPDSFATSVQQALAAKSKGDVAGAQKALDAAKRAKPTSPADQAKEKQLLAKMANVNEDWKSDLLGLAAIAGMGIATANYADTKINNYVDVNGEKVNHFNGRLHTDATPTAGYHTSFYGKPAVVWTGTTKNGKQLVFWNWKEDANAPSDKELNLKKPTVKPRTMESVAPAAGDAIVFELADGRGIDASIAEVRGNSIIVDIDETAAAWLDSVPTHAELAIGNINESVTKIAGMWNGMLAQLESDTPEGWAKTMVRNEQAPDKWSRIWKLQHEALGASISRADLHEWVAATESAMNELAIPDHMESLDPGAAKLRKQLDAKDDAMLAVWILSHANKRNLTPKQYAKQIARKTGYDSLHYWQRISDLVEESDSSKPPGQRMQLVDPNKAWGLANPRMIFVDDDPQGIHRYKTTSFDPLSIGSFEKWSNEQYHARNKGYQLHYVGNDPDKRREAMDMGHTPKVKGQTSETTVDETEYQNYDERDLKQALLNGNYESANDIIGYLSTNVSISPLLSKHHMPWAQYLKKELQTGIGSPLDILRTLHQLRKYGADWPEIQSLQKLAIAKHKKEKNTIKMLHTRLNHIEDEPIYEAEYQGREVKLGKPIRTDTSTGGKFKVYVRDPKTGNIKMVRFGDTTGLSIKRDDPERRRNFRARHHCDTPGPRTKARYWSCRMWTRKPVGKILKGK